jgi:hypothetical protein
MQHRARTPEETYGPALEKAQKALPDIDPARQAANAGIAFKPGDPRAGRFVVPFFGATYEVTWPAGEVRRTNDGTEADIASRILLLHYLLTADGAAAADRWIAFRNLPGGLGYEPAFQARANLRLARAFGAERAAFEAAAQALKGESLSFGDASFVFRMLPRLWLAVVLYLTDDEFPASAQVLFDASASHYLPTEDLAVLGGLLAGRLIRASRPR